MHDTKRTSGRSAGPGSLQRNHLPPFQCKTNLQDLFHWEGIILAGKLPEFVVGMDYEIEGHLITGLDGSQGAVWLWDGGEVEYHSCNSIDASNSLTYLAPLDNTWWESF